MYKDKRSTLVKISRKYTQNNLFMKNHLYYYFANYGWSNWKSVLLLWQEDLF